MDIIKCLTCRTPEMEWVHGVHPDAGGMAAHAHKMDHPDHDVRVGEVSQLESLGGD